MTWRGTALTALSVILGLQVALGVGFWLGRGQGAANGVVVFDPEKSLTTFVIWSSNRIDDDDFTTILPKFQERVEFGLRTYAEENGVVVVRSNGILMGTEYATADVTDQIMTWVLDDEAF